MRGTIGDLMSTQQAVRNNTTYPYNEGPIRVPTPGTISWPPNPPPATPAPPAWIDTSGAGTWAHPPLTPTRRRVDDLFEDIMALSVREYLVLNERLARAMGYDANDGG